MTADGPNDDRTVIRPTGGFAAGSEKTQIVAAPPPHEPDMGNGLPVGTRLGEFEITSLLGEGGFGIVYLANDLSLHRQVAIKEYMPSALASRTSTSQVVVKSARHSETFEAGRKSFVNEARLLAQFDHPSLVKVYRFWEANGTAYMVMPFYEGKNLRDTLRSMPQAPDETWLRTLLQPLTEALTVIHAEQCFHRDIAPDNVMMLAASQRPLLLDFGAARRVIGDMTQALTVILKPGYAPVEQYAEIPGMKQGAWTDLYALAAVVHYAITGRTPPPSVGRLLNDTYVPLVQSAAGRYSEAFLSAIDRALQVRPESRTQSVGDLRSQLGMGELSFDPYTTKPLPPGFEYSSEVQPEAPRTARAPVAAREAARVATPLPARTLQPVILAGVGVLVLAALGWGGYSLLAPASRPAAIEPTAGPATTQSPAATPAVMAPPPAAPTTEPFNVSAQFARVVQAQTPGFGVRTQAAKSTFRIDHDELSFTLQSDREGFVYVFMYGSDKQLTQLYPNIESGTLKIARGQTLKLPQLPIVLGVGEPPGPGELLVMVSARQRDHSDLRPRQDGVWRVFPLGAEAAALAAALPGPLPALAGRAICPSSGACPDDFGASLIKVETIR